MATVGYATLDVIPSVKGMRQQLDRQTSGDLVAGGKAGGKKYGDAAGREAATSFRGRFSGAMRGFAPLAGLAAGAGTVAFFKSAIDGASDLAESTSKAEVVFGSASESVLKFADNAALGLGQSETEALSAAGVFGNLLRSVGLAEEQSAKFSTTMVGLASDLASFNNTSVQEATDALRAGLVGETEPLKRFGVNLNDATLKAKALELGLSDGKATLDANAKAQSAYALIMEQTTLAQGDFARTSDGLANQQRILSAQWDEMTTALGQELLPAATGFVSFMNDKGIPALSTAGGVAKDAVTAFANLPSPILGAAAAFGALKVASATGLTSALGSGVASARSAMDSLRVRTMLAGDEYRRLRTASINLDGPMRGVNLGASRGAAAFGALSVAAQGAGGAMRRSLSGAIGLLGGPWGIALIGATAGLAKFWGEQQEAKARVEELTASLDKQTGSLSESSRESIYNALVSSGAIDAAKLLGISLEDVQAAAEGETAAISRVNEALAQTNTVTGQNNLAGLASDTDDTTKAVGTLERAINGQNEEVSASQNAWRDARAALGDSTSATDDAAESTKSYADRLKEAKDRLQGLIDKEAERADGNVQARRDQLALNAAVADAREEARKGKQTLDQNTAAGEANMTALLDLADAWNTSSEKVRNAKGAYSNTRQEFIDLATAMGGGGNSAKARARELATELLGIPEKVGPKYRSEGYQKALSEAQLLASQLKALDNIETTLVYGTQRARDGRPIPEFAHGGKVGGYGTGDNQLILADPREWVMNPRATAYYGDAFMNALNNMQVPRFANGGPVAAAPSRASAPAGVTVNIGQVVQPSYGGLMNEIQRRATAANSDGARMGVR